MNRSYKEIAQKLSENMRYLHSKKKSLVGFDGFKDLIYRSVEERTSPEQFEPIATISQLGKKIENSGGKSCNIELVRERTKIGGNAPILTQVLGNLQLEVNFIGAIGSEGRTDPLFSSIESLCTKAYPVSAPGTSYAIEFQDGKVIFGEHHHFKEITFQKILDSISLQELTQMFEESDLIATVNWTMLPHLSSIWREIECLIIPNLSKKNRLFFVDLADPAKRKKNALKEAIEILKSLQNHFSIILGLNRSEAEQLTELLLNRPAPSSLKESVALLGEALPFSQLLIHTSHEIAAYSEGEINHINTFYCKEPLIMTGAGDHFNGGYLSALLYDLTIEEALYIGAATSSYYVQTGATPTTKDIEMFFDCY